MVTWGVGGCVWKLRVVDGWSEMKWIVGVFGGSGNVGEGGQSVNGWDPD